MKKKNMEDHIIMQEIKKKEKREAKILKEKFFRKEDDL